MALRLRLRVDRLGGVGLIAVLLAVGALFPAVGHTFGKLNIPKGVADLLGGADYGTITGWYRSEISSIYGPLVVGALAITGAASTTAGEEEDHILALVLAHPVRRSRLVVAKAGAIAAVVVLIVVATWVGLIGGVALAGGGITIARITAYCVHLAFFGFAIGAIALALGAGTGRRTLAVGVAAAVGLLGWLINAFVPLVSGSPGSSTSRPSTTTPATTRSAAASTSSISSSSVCSRSLGLRSGSPGCGDATCARRGCAPGSAREWRA